MSIAPQPTACAETIAQVLGGKRSGNGWRAPCPAHDGKGQNLSITEKQGRVLVHCFTGCSQQEVITALQAMGLWPKHERKRAPVVHLATRRDLYAECRALEHAISRGTASTEQCNQYRSAIRRLCAPHSPDDVLLMHHWCLQFQALVKRGERPTQAEERDFLRFSRVVQRCGVPYEL